MLLLLVVMAIVIMWLGSGILAYGLLKETRRFIFAREKMPYYNSEEEKNCWLMILLGLLGFLIAYDYKRKARCQFKLCFKMPPELCRASRKK